MSSREDHAYRDEAPTAVSLFSGIGGLDHGLHLAGFRHLLMCEGGGDPNGTDAERAQYAQGVYRRAVLRARFPGVPIAEDVRDIGVEPVWARGRSAAGARHAGEHESGERWLIPQLPVDLVAGGSPCQDLSVAGQRRGLAGDRSGLFFEYVRVVDAVRPRWFLWENVPGALSSNGGRDFGAVLGTLADVGYGLAWRILDSRYFGVPQRRRRVFVVGTLADGDPRAAAQRAGQVLAVGTRCPRHPATRGEAREDVAAPFDGGAISTLQKPNGGWRIDAEAAAGGHLIANGLVKRYGKGTDSDATDTLIADTARSHPRPGSNSNGNLVAGPLGGGNDGIGRRSEDDPNLVAVDLRNGTAEGEATMTLQGGAAGQRGYDANSIPHVLGASVRRLMPVECERLQGLPDSWTDLGGTKDSPRYAALGDAVTASVAEWIGQRIIEHL